jgi:ADP-ribose pyrophosphatase YjhB (NUDIX family)
LIMKRIGVAGIIRGGAHTSTETVYTLLLGRRGKDPNRGLYVLPGGAVQDGESLEQAFVREILEETGLQVQPTVGYSRWEHPALIELPDRIILVGQAVIKGSLAPSAGSDLYDVGWFDYLALPPDISSVVMPVLNMYGFHQRKKIVNG